MRAVVVRHNTVRSIYSVHEIDQNHPNGYVLQALFNETYVHELTQLKINHSLILSYHFLNESSEEDRRFSGLDDVISGREILIKNGQIQQANWERPADGWSAICIDSNNKLSLAVYFPVRTELPVSEELCYLAPDFLEDNSYCRWGEKTYKSYFAQLLKDKLSCQQAIYLDAGASTTLVTFDHSGNSQIIGKNIVVSDALVVMP